MEASLGGTLFATLILAQFFAVVAVRAWRADADPIDVSRPPEPPRSGAASQELIMTELSAHTQLSKFGATDPLAGWLFPSTLIFGSVLAALLIAAAYEAPRSGPIDETVAPELPPITRIVGERTPEIVRVATAARAAAIRPPFAFGFLEFDWDPNAPGGVPGFDPWPTHDSRVAEASPRN
jgi:hypothetical protein